MLESVTVHGPFSVAAIARTCRDTLAGVVEPDGRCHGAQISAVAAASAGPAVVRQSNRMLVLSLATMMKAPKCEQSLRKRKSFARSG